MACESNQLHFLLFPFMAQGHMIPMVDIAKLLAHRGIIVTLVTTPLNAKRFATTLSRATQSGLPINFIQLQFPSVEAGLPKDCESFDALPSLGLALKFFGACNMLQEQVERLFPELKPRPSCIISDMSFPYTSRVASKFCVPRVSFNGFSTFCYLCLQKINVSRVLEGITSDSEYFVVPGLPDHIELTKNQLPLPSILLKNMEVFNEQVMEAEMSSYGIIINSFEELEAGYVQAYKNMNQGRVWCIGPVSLCNKDNFDKFHRGNNSSIDESEYLKWLSSQQPESVIYVCLGSLCNLMLPQLIELGLGIEASNKPFIWVIRGGDQSKQVEKWIEEDGFEERTKRRGLIIRGWAPQVAILSHRAIGGFLTHCGWNSTLEGICAGMPMVTWPLFADQFCNEKLVVDVLKVGVKVGAEETMKWGEEEEIGVKVKREGVKEAILKLMDEGDEREDMRKRVHQLSQFAKVAIEKGGSSYYNMELLLQDIMQHNIISTKHL